MIKKPLRKLLGLFMGKKAAGAAAEVIDHGAKKVIDKKTGGAASKLDEII